MYGLPELFADQVSGAELVANPGCYATAAIVSLAPLLGAGLVEPGAIRVDGKTGLSGAGKAAIGQVLRRRPRAIAYVACDPAALARDLGTALSLGYRLAGLRAYDLFPMTHHLECVAIIEPADRPGKPARSASAAPRR